ncbi:MAG: GNAT family N-acetyltransferase [Bacilli bacterium]|nr:GNAT family N-acetyltransferase [Bacilli bacterium]
MIKEITKDNISIIDNSFIDKEVVINELNNNPFAKYLVLFKNSEVIGYLYYSDIYDRVEINQIEINSIHRNCGYGSKLLEYLINSVNKNITLEVNKENIYAIKLYKKYNFKEVAIRKGYYSGIDGILMERLFK